MPDIDPSIFFDEDGKAYITNNQDPEGVQHIRHKATWIQEFDWEKQQNSCPRKMIRNGGHNLADKPIDRSTPHIKVHGYYYLTTAEGGTSITIHSYFPQQGHLGPL